MVLCLWPETKQQSSQQKTATLPCPILIYFSDLRGWCIWNSFHQIRLLTRVSSCGNSVRQKRSDLWQQVFLPHNAHAHTAISIGKCLTKNGMTPLPQPPNLASCNFFLLPQMKRDLKWKRFADKVEMKKEMRKTLLGITTNEFTKCFEQWNKR